MAPKQDVLMINRECVSVFAQNAHSDQFATGLFVIVMILLLPQATTCVLRPSEMNI